MTIRIKKEYIEYFWNLLTPEFKGILKDRTDYFELLMSAYDDAELELPEDCSITMGDLVTRAKQKVEKKE